MNCPHCAAPISDAAVVKAAASINASKPRPGAKGQIRNPTGKRTRPAQ